MKKLKYLTAQASLMFTTEEEPGTALAIPEGMVMKTVSKEELGLLAKMGDWLPYVTIVNATSKAAQEHGEDVGSIAIMENQIPINLGTEAVFVVFGERTKAMSTQDGVQSFYDIRSEEFKAVHAKAKPGQTVYLSGIEYLLWTPAIGDQGTFCTLFCSNASLKKEVPVLRTFLGGKAMLAKTGKVKNAKGTWWKATFHRYTAPIPIEPDPEEFKKVVNSFNNPKASTAEKAPENTSGRER